MVGGIITSSEALYREGENRFCMVQVQGTGCEKTTRCQVKLKLTIDATPLIRKGKPCWWHDKKAFIYTDEGKEVVVEKVGNSSSVY